MKNLILFAILILFLPFNAHAYLDPGSGSMILQLIVAGVAGLFVGLKFFWGRIVAFFKGNKPKDSNKE